MIIKRDNSRVNFDKNRIINAVNKAMNETQHIDSNLSNLIATTIEFHYKDKEVSVEEIQDVVEKELMDSNRKDVAKKYILYRDKKNNIRKPNKYKLLSENFLSKYKHVKNPMTALGEFVYYRTYSRWVNSEKRREYWWETCARTVDFNCGLVDGVTRQEAEELFDNMFYLRLFPSGRQMFVGGTKSSRENGQSNFNCAGIVMNNISKYKDLFVVLMLGAGCGIRVLFEDVDKLPLISADKEVIHQPYHGIVKERRRELTSIEFLNNTVTIVVGDSREGWGMALDWYLKIISEQTYRNVKVISFNYDNVRPKGEKLLTFGGRASGSGTLKNMFKKIHHLIVNEGLAQSKERIKLRPINCLDIANIIGENVVSGSVRRTSLVGLIDKDDKETIEAKSGLYYQNENGVWQENTDISHRKMSNNSIFYKEKPSREQLHWQIKTMRYSGEPAFINAEKGKNIRDDFEIVNPCCFTGDMRLLTRDGYKTFEELSGKEIDIINKDGDVSSGKIWHNGEKEVVEVVMSNKTTIKCTPDHVFMLNDGSECKAIDLKGKRVKTYIGNANLSLSLFVRKVEKIGIEKVYDFSEPITNWGVVEGVVVHNCEIALSDLGMCNLTSNNAMAYVEYNKFNLESFLNSQRLSARMGLRNTCIDFEMHEWDLVQKRDRLLGCSIMGWQDMINATNMSKEEYTAIWEQAREVVVEEAKKYSIELGIPEPLLTTTFKPDGSIAQLPTVSSGIHYSHSPYYIRRVRISAYDPLVKVCEELEYPVTPENGQTLENCNTKVVAFPVKSPVGKTKYDVSALEQLENYKESMKHYVTHNTSITVHVRDHEWEQVEQWMFDNWDCVLGISFLSLDDNFYPQAPYEAITEEEYNKRVSEIKPFNPSLISKYEIEEMELDIGESECVGGVCPIR